MSHRYLSIIPIILWWSLICPLGVAAQPVLKPDPTNGPSHVPTMRAVVIGVSQYQDQGVRPLHYAHKDAQAFADYLHSDAAGKMQKEVRTLINADATLAAVDDAMNWLKTSSVEGDMALLYFAGHGDVEVAALWQLGYLLTYDSPPNNFRNNAIRVEDLDLLAIELSSVRNVRTMFILDACRSGTLADGRNVPTENLTKQKANEVRILSCKPDQKSLEGASWGGGRGVFSYYLIRGLQGLANDAGNTSDLESVTVEELEDYFRKTVVRDTKSLDPPQRQDPIIVSGAANIPVGVVVPEILATLTEDNKNKARNPSQPISENRSMSDPVTIRQVAADNPVDVLFTKSGEKELFEYLDIASLLKIPARDIPEAILQHLTDVARDQYWPPEVQDNLKEYWSIADLDKDDPEDLQLFNTKLAIALHDRGQEIINSYLRADPGDLEERSIIKFETTKYRWYPDLFKLVIKLLPEGHPLQDRVAVKEAYFSGASIRILALDLEDPLPAYNEAEALLQKALRLDPYAPYVHNELGIIYMRKNVLDKSEYHFNRAVELAPGWGFPYANLGVIFIQQNRLSEAQENVAKALRLIPDNYLPHLHQGQIHELNRRFLDAETEYQRCIRLLPEDIIAYNRLGHLYLQTSEYAKANKHLKTVTELAGLLPPSIHTLLFDEYRNPEADHPFDYPVDMATRPVMHYPPDLDLDDPGITPDIDRALQHMQLGIAYCQSRLYEQAVDAFQAVIRLDVHYKDVYDHLAWAYLKLEKYDLADRMLTLAERNTEAVSGREMLEALVAERCGRWSEAATIYRKLIDDHLHAQLGYQKLAAFYETTDQYVEAEWTYQEYMGADQEAGQSALYSFYLRMADMMPSQYSWKQRAAMILYEKCMEAAESGFGTGYARKAFQPHALPSTVDEFYSSCYSPLPYSIHPDLQDKQSACKASEKLFRSIYPFLKTSGERAAILEKTGNIHAQLLNEAQALTDHQRAFDLAPYREDLRDTLINRYKADQDYTKVMKLMTDQDSLGHLRYQDLLILIRMNNLNGHLEHARDMMEKSEELFPTPEESRSLAELEAQNAILEGDLTRALNLYEGLHSHYPDSGESAWSIARIHASQNHRNKAFQWVDKALELGFRKYEWVVARDPVMAKLRRTSKWQRIMNE